MIFFLVPYLLDRMYQALSSINITPLQWIALIYSITGAFSVTVTFPDCIEGYRQLKLARALDPPSPPAVLRSLMQRRTKVGRLITLVLYEIVGLTYLISPFFITPPNYIPGTVLFATLIWSQIWVLVVSVLDRRDRDILDYYLEHVGIPTLGTPQKPQEVQAIDTGTNTQGLG